MFEGKWLKELLLIFEKTISFLQSTKFGLVEKAAHSITSIESTNRPQCLYSLCRICPFAIPMRCVNVFVHRGFPTAT